MRSWSRGLSRKMTDAHPAGVHQSGLINVTSRLLEVLCVQAVVRGLGAGRCEETADAHLAGVQQGGPGRKGPHHQLHLEAAGKGDVSPFDACPSFCYMLCLGLWFPILKLAGFITSLQVMVEGENYVQNCGYGSISIENALHVT